MTLVQCYVPTITSVHTVATSAPTMTSGHEGCLVPRKNVTDSHGQVHGKSDKISINQRVRKWCFLSHVLVTDTVTMLLQNGRKNYLPTLTLIIFI
jgi:hypothetical protein